MAADMKHKTLRGQRGMTLLEVLISLLIFSLGMLGFVGLQARATQLSVDSEDRTRAALMANEVVSAMWTQRTTSLPAATTTAWRTRLQDSAVAGLPNASGTIADAGGVVTVTVTWKSPSQPAAAASSVYSTSLVMP
jgi:type IV pilus assembly protein PilV